MSSFNLVLTTFLTLTIMACSNLTLEGLDERLDDNFGGSLSEPASIDPTGTNSFSFVVMGDTHVGSPGGEVMRRIARDAQTAGDSFALVAGDCTQGGLDGEYSQFKAVFAEFNLAVRAAIGNHDIYFGGWKNFKSQLGKSIYSFDADNVHVVILDTANGVLGERQLSWYEDDLKRNTQPHIITISHFPPWVGHYSSIFKMSSEEETAILKDINYRYGVKYFVSGHYHGSADILIGGTKYIVSGGANDLIDFNERQNYIRFHVNGSDISYDRIQY